MQAKREVHEHIRRRLEQRLGGRSWSWLAREAGLPKSTLTDQARVPRFELYTLLRVAKALDSDLAALLPPGTLHRHRS